MKAKILIVLLALALVSGCLEYDGIAKETTTTIECAQRDYNIYRYLKAYDLIYNDLNSSDNATIAENLANLTDIAFHDITNSTTTTIESINSTLTITGDSIAYIKNETEVNEMKKTKLTLEPNKWTTELGYKLMLTKDEGGVLTFKIDGQDGTIRTLEVPHSGSNTFKGLTITHVRDLDVDLELDY